MQLFSIWGGVLDSHTVCEVIHCGKNGHSLRASAFASNTTLIVQPTVTVASHASSFQQNPTNKVQPYFGPYKCCTALKRPLCIELTVVQHFKARNCHSHSLPGFSRWSSATLHASSMGQHQLPASLTVFSNSWADEDKDLNTLQHIKVACECCNTPN